MESGKSSQQPENHIRPAYDKTDNNPGIFDRKTFFLLYDSSNQMEENAAQGLVHMIKKYGGRFEWDENKIDAGVLPIVATESRKLIGRLARKTPYKLFSKSLIEYCVKDKNNLIKLTSNDLPNHVYGRWTDWKDDRTENKMTQTHSLALVTAEVGCQTKTIACTEMGCQTDEDFSKTPEIDITGQFCQPLPLVQDEDNVSQMDSDVEMDEEDDTSEDEEEAMQQEANNQRFNGTPAEKRQKALELVLDELKNATKIHPSTICNKVAKRTEIKGKTIIQWIWRAADRGELFQCFGLNKKSDKWKLKAVERLEEYYLPRREIYLRRVAAKKQN